MSPRGRLADRRGKRTLLGTCHLLLLAAKSNEPESLDASQLTLYRKSDEDDITHLVQFSAIATVLLFGRQVEPSEVLDESPCDLGHASSLACVIPTRYDEVNGHPRCYPPHPPPP